jgi:hypothetical protein
MDILTQPFAAGVMVLVGLVFMPAADAQTQSPSPPQQAQPSPPQQAPSITDQKLDQTAAAMKRVVSVKQDYQQRIAAAAPSDKDRIAEEGKKELAKAVTDQGLSVGEYSAILEVAQKDPNVLEKLKERMGSQAK